MGLTSRQKTLLSLLASGCSEKEAASKMKITINTVKDRKHSIFKNLGAVNSSQAVAIAKDKGII